MNLGVILKERAGRDWVAGGYTPLQPEVLRANGQWDDFLPVLESQNRYGLETLACVTFSALNCLETLYKRIKGADVNFSDRYSAKMNGTTIYGNSMYRVAESARKDGVIPEELWPWETTMDTWDEYYSTVPQNIINEGQDFLGQWSVYNEWVNQTNLENQLKFGPVQVIVRYAVGDGILNPAGDYNHAVMCYGYTPKAWKIMDHYDNSPLKLYDKDYQFKDLMRYNLIAKSTIMFTPKNNQPYVLVEGPSQLMAMGLDGKLVIYNDRLDAVVNGSSRSKSAYLMTPTPLTLAQWNSVPHVDGKGNPI